MSNASAKNFGSYSNSCHAMGHPQSCAFSLRAFETGGAGSSEGDPFYTPTNVQCMSAFPYHFL